MTLRQTRYGSPAYSPDLNPIEQAWSVLKRKVRHIVSQQQKTILEALDIGLKKCSIVYLTSYTGFVQSLIKLCGLDWAAPDYSTLFRRQKHIDIAIRYQKSRHGLHLLVDSTGLKFLGEGEWKRKKHQPEYRRQWNPANTGCSAHHKQCERFTSVRGFT